MEPPGIFERLDVPTVINAAGTKTRVSGTLMRPAAADAMREAAEAFVRVSDLQARASEAIADATGAEAGYVTSGAAAGLTLATAAAIAGRDPEAMARLPDTESLPSEVVMPRSQRNAYDHAIRLAGAEVIGVGGTDYEHGCGATNVEPWELEAAITEETAAVAYLAKPDRKLPIETVAEVAHHKDVPVIVDAAAALPPTTNLRRFVAAGADLVVYSGGKAIRGPQTTGILAGRADLIESAALQHLDMHVAADAWIPPEELFDPSGIEGVPRHGIGRPMKVGVEEIAGLLVALEEFCEEDHEALQAEWSECVESIADQLREADALSVEITHASKIDVVPSLTVAVDEAAAGRSATELVRSLREEDPRVFVGGDELHRDAFTINPMNLTDREADYLAERVLAAVDE